MYYRLHKLEFDFSKQKEFYFLLCSDLHLDCKSTDLGKIKEEFDDIKKKNGRIFINGDVLEVILPTDKKRYTKSVDPWDISDILGGTIDLAFDFLRPYADYIDIIGLGNHESSIVKYHHIDLVQQIIQKLNVVRDRKYQPIANGGYQGFIRLRFHRKQQATRTYDIFYNHGQGGSSEVTKGIIDLDRRTSVDCDLVWLGHKHKVVSTLLNDSIGLDKNMNIVSRKKRGVVTGCYRKDPSESTGRYEPSYSAEKMRTPESNGGAVLCIDLYGRHDPLKDKIIH